MKKVEFTMYNGKIMMLEYEFDNLFKAKGIIKAYKQANREYYVRKECLRKYKIYAEWNTDLADF